MKSHYGWMVIVVLLLTLGLFACSPAATEEVETTAPETTPVVEEAAPEPEARFTIQADGAVQGAVTAVYTTLYPNEQPAFVATDADLLVTAAHENAAATILPNTVLVPLSDNTNVADFIAFAVSPDGQQVLINAGSLPASVTLTDQAGNTVEIPQPIYHVISSHGPTTFLVYGVGAGDRLVAASYLGARDPAGAAAMTRIDPRFEEVMGDDYFTQGEFNAEEAVKLDPDLITASARTQWLDVAAELGISTFLFEAETPEALKEAMLLAGQLFGPNATAQAQAWVAYYDGVVSAVKEQTAVIPDEERVRVLFTGSDPLQAASGEMYQSSMIEAAGGQSVSADLVGYWNDVNLEQIAAWNPDVIVIPPYGGATVEAITDSPEWQILDAVQAGRVYQIPKLVAPWDTPAPDSVLGIIWLAETLYPEQVQLSCAGETETFYNTFYGYDISAEEIAALCGE
jgi:iron complex transport system substrate-binding protein